MSRRLHAASAQQNHLRRGGRLVLCHVHSSGQSAPSVQDTSGMLSNIFTSRFSVIGVANIGIVLLVEPGTEEQAALRVLHADDPLRRPPGGRHSRDARPPQVVVRIDPLRRVNVRDKGIPIENLRSPPRHEKSWRADVSKVPPREL